MTNEENAHCDDYADSGYDRGHIVPRDDMNRTSATQADAFYLSNVAPQTPSLNRGIWRWLEELVRSYAKKYGTVYVLTGSVIQEPAQTAPSGNVKIPSRFFKVLLRAQSDGTSTALAIVLPNLQRGLPVPPGTMGVQGERVSAEIADAFLTGHTVSVREVENLTGLDLLPGSMQNRSSGLWRQSCGRAIDDRTGRPRGQTAMGVVSITVRLPEELWQAARLWASREGNENTVVVRALEDYLSRSHEDQVERQPGKYAALVRGLSTLVEDLHLSARAATCLRMLQIRFMYELVEKTPRDLWMQRNFDKKSLGEVEDKLAALGLTLGMALDPTAYAAAVTAVVVASIRAATTTGPAPATDVRPAVVP
ncbi:MAG: DNA/RNA non-specific endonuclease [Candidatus Methylomirabilales bacterium]